MSATISKPPSSSDRDEAARLLAHAHRRSAPELPRVFRVAGDESEEPIKLLEVNPHTFPAGILPIYFTANPPTVPFASIVIEVTEEELAQVMDGRLPLPHGWVLSEEIEEAD